jgi:hypothetical protein
VTQPLRLTRDILVSSFSLLFTNGSSCAATLRCTLCTVRGKQRMYTPTIPEISAFLTGRLAQFYRELTLTVGLACTTLIP